MAKIIVNGKEVLPAKKVNLNKTKSRAEIQKLIKEKREEKKNQ